MNQEVRMAIEGGSASTAATYISRLPTIPGRLRLAVKDVIDVCGMKTSAGSRLVFDLADPADRDAECLKHARADNVTIVGKTNLHELAFGFTGVNPHFGTPINPLDPSLIPGGSSSGSAVAVATGEADVAIGTDSAGSVRMPAACCGIVGLKLTNGSVPLAGVWPLAPSLDSLGVFGRDVDAVRIAAELLTGNDIVMRRGEPKVGRLRGITVHPMIDRAVDAALMESNVKYSDACIDHWDDAVRAARTLIAYEAWNSNRSIIASYEEYDSGIGQDVMRRLQRGKCIGEFEIKEVGAVRATLVEQTTYLFEEFEILALPTLPIPPPQFALAEAVDLAHLTAPVNLLGLPALALPIRSGSVIASLQLMAAWDGEAALLTLAKRIAKAIGSPWTGRLRH